MSSNSADDAPSYVAVVGWIVGSIGSSVGLILVNKLLMSTFHFQYVFTLTAMHFLVTALGMEMMAVTGFFTRQRMPLSDTVLMALFCIGSVAFMNFSLQENSVGFYQVAKLLCIPAMVAIQTYAYNQHFSMKIKTTLAVVLLGVGIATVTDVQITEFGLLLGALAVLFTAQFQIWQGDKQKAHKMNAMQMNHAQAAPSFLVCAVLAVVFEFRGADPKNNVLLHEFMGNEAAWILLSCALALSVNLCTYGLIGKTSAVTYQVVGHAKTCLILLGGFLLFPPDNLKADLLAKNLFGIAIALIGVVVYSNLKITETSGPNNTPQRDWCDEYVPDICLRYIDPQTNPQTNGYEMVNIDTEAQTPETNTAHK